MKKLLFVTSFMLFSVAVYAQTFVCTDINYFGSDLSPQKIQKEKAKYLGSKATLAFYDKSVKLSTTEDGKVESVVLDKVNDNEYQAIDKRGNNVKKIVLKLNKWIEYIRSFTIEGYENYSLQATVTYKRE